MASVRRFYQRIYTLEPGGLPKIAMAWEKALPERLKLSPLAAVWNCASDSAGRSEFSATWTLD